MPTSAAPVPVAVATAVSAASATAHFEEPTRVESGFSLAEAINEIADEPIAESKPAVPNQPEAPASQPAAVSQSGPDSAQNTPEAPEPVTVADNTADEAAPTNGDEHVADKSSDEEQANDDSAAKVSNLEEEMARLLGEITSKRES